MLRVLILLVLISSPAWGHDLWIEKEGNTYVLYQGHRHSSHRGPESVPYELSAVKGFLCRDNSGTVKNLRVTKVYPATVSSDCATLHAIFSTGYWTKTAWDIRNIPKTGVSGVIKSWYSEESLTLIEHWRGSSATPIGAGFEITPMTNPLLLKAGDKLVVRVTDGGKPVAGVPVAYAGDTRGASGEDGTVSIRLRQSGVQLLAASREIPLSDDKADTAIRTASLQFEIAQ